MRCSDLAIYIAAILSIALLMTVPVLVVVAVVQHSGSAGTASLLCLGGGFFVGGVMSILIVIDFARNP